MYTYTIEHKNCGMTTTITGNNVYDAFKNSYKDIRFWTVKEIEKNA